MSQKDLQFIERALVHPWMFWVYFWKWPRIVRQACAEYDLLAKERDAAKAAHERSERANKIVRDWIHVTHRLSTTPEAIRAIFAAGKRLSILLVFFVVTNAFGQAPPYLRNQWDTNANPLALKVISTNGVHAATNVWELDFTNTATVTVSAVSNANKVMVSFTGSGGGGDTIWTNYGANAYTLIVMPGTIQVFTNGVISSFPTGTNKQSHLTNGGFSGFYSIDSTGVSTPITEGGLAVARFHSDDGLGNSNSVVEGKRGGIGVATIEGSTDISVIGQDGGVAAAFAYWSTNIDIFGDSGGFAGGYTESSVGARIRAVDGSIAGGQVVSSHGGWTSSPFVVVQASDGGLAFGNISTSSNINVLGDEGSITTADIFTSTNSLVSSQDGSIVAAYVRGANTTNAAFIGSIAAGITRSGERLVASGALDGVGALSVGRDIASTNNWTFGIHYTNTVPLSLAVGANGTTQFRAASNSVVIRTETTPTVGQILTATDTSGTVGWSNAPAGSDIVWTNDGTYIYPNNKTNNVAVPGSLYVATNGGLTALLIGDVQEGINYYGLPYDDFKFGIFSTPKPTRNDIDVIWTAFSPAGDNYARHEFYSIAHTNDDQTYTFHEVASQRDGMSSAMTMRSVASTNNSNAKSFIEAATSDQGFVTRSSFTLTTFGSFGGVGNGNGGAMLTMLSTQPNITNAFFLNFKTNTTASVFSVDDDGNIFSKRLTPSTVLWANSSTNIASIANGAGVLTNNGTGTLGWKPLSDFVSGGGGIASVYTNNVLAGGPGLTELEFTNTATVTWAATTNAGRVTMSATSAGGGSGIATNEGTGFKTTFYGQTNFGNITFTNGARIEQPTATITRFTNSTFDFGGDMTFTPDSTWSIGSGTKRPNHFNMAGVLTAGSHVTTFGSFLLGNNGGLTTIADGSAYLRNNAATDWGRLAFGGSTAAFPALKRNAGHLAVVDAAGSNSTNSLFFGNTVDTTASTGVTMNRQTGRVRLSAGNQTYLVTNNLATANSIVTATVNSDDSTALSVKAIPSAGVITLKVNAAATANTDISFFISAP